MALFLVTRNVFGGFVVYGVLLAVYIVVRWKELWVYAYKTNRISCSKAFSFYSSCQFHPYTNKFAISAKILSFYQFTFFFL